MNTPALVPVHPDELPIHVLRDALVAGAGPLRWFRVVREGVFDHRTWQAGDLIVCGGRPGPDERIVLIPTGRGRPLFGHRRRDGLRGDRGEPCDASRWMPAGAVLRVLERALPVHEPAPIDAVFYRRRPVAEPQLALFPQTVAA